MDLKDELLATTALRVHDGEKTLLVTFNQDEAELLVARRDNLFSRGGVANASHTFIEVVPGSAVSEWRRETEDAAVKVSARHDWLALEGDDGLVLTEETVRKAYSKLDVNRYILYPCVVSLPEQSRLPVLRLALA